VVLSAENADDIRLDEVAQLEADPRPRTLIVSAEAYDRLRERRWLSPSATEIHLIGPVPGQPSSPEVILAHGFQSPLGRGSRAAKRLIDLVLGSLLLIAAAPVIFVAAIAIKLDSRGPVLFEQERLGAHGKRFRIYKMRSMRVGNDDGRHREYLARLIDGDAESHGGVFKLVDDDRITRVGRALRKLSIDELPQLFNVVKGEMSLVGPRPPLPSEAARYDSRTWMRLWYKPGMTGLWQVSGRNRLDFSQMVDLDLKYWLEWSLRSELKILARTPATVLAGTGK
jgi:lipopolysaccharide/colanic/teichoic acid biosynthesis glycosyltransferase